MVMQLDEIVPFGRSFDEYVKMFSLDDRDLQSSILSVADGPASFNAEGTERGYHIHSVDPLYAFTASEIRDRFYAVRDNIIDQIKATPDNWVWTYHASADDLSARRTRVAERFAADFSQFRASHTASHTASHQANNSDLSHGRERYAIGKLPKLSYPDGAYGLGLCSHFLFLYSEQLDTAFHMAAIGELLRVCHEVRIFPLLNLSQKTSPHLPPVIEHFEALGYGVSLETVDYELQPGGNKMLKIIRIR